MKNIRLTVKLMGGFAIVALVTLLVGFAGWYSSSSLGSQLEAMVNEHLPSVANVLTMRENLESVRVANRTLLNPFLTVTDRNRQYENIAAAQERYQKAMESLEPTIRDADESALWKQLVPALTAWRQETDKFLEFTRELERTGVLNPLALSNDLERFRGDHYKVLTQSAYLLHTQTNFEGSEDPSACGFGKWLASYHTDNPKITALLKDILPVHAAFHHSVKKMKDLVKAGDLEGASTVYRQEMVPAAEGAFALFGALQQQVAQASELYSRMNDQAMVVVYAKQKQALELLQKFVEKQKSDAEAAKNVAVATKNRARYIMLLGILIGVVAAALLGLSTSLAVTRPLKRVIEGLSEGSSQVAAASEEVSSASQKLAEGASQQAAAVEETSSSLEELSSMTRQNAANANETNQLMKEIQQTINQANQSMSELTTSMTAINKASVETQKIIKTIDEIAFQTNLLALNAAVEAARAGEAGAGFAVVADEVRNLAMRAAEAARNTANLIEGTVKEVRGGSDVVEKTNQEFEQLVSGVNKAGELVGEITAASGEQAQGIEQINRAVTEMDQVIQANAASAEESASAAEELNAQAEQMRFYVKDLATLVGGDGDGRRTHGGQQVTAALSATIPRLSHQVLERSGKILTETQKRSISSQTDGSREVRPEQVISLNDGGVDDF